MNFLKSHLPIFGHPIFDSLPSEGRHPLKSDTSLWCMDKRLLFCVSVDTLEMLTPLSLTERHTSNKDLTDGNNQTSSGPNRIKKDRDGNTISITISIIYRFLIKTQF